MASSQRAAEVDKMKQQMMSVMNIKDPKELQRMAQEYCKDMAADLSLPGYHRFLPFLASLHILSQAGHPGQQAPGEGERPV
jgi:hypothetical protein